MKRTLIAVWTLLVAGGGACGETPDHAAKDRNLLSFAGTGCKFHADDEVLALHGLYTIADGDAYYGLTCLSWQTSASGVLQLDILNHKGACGAEYTGQATSDGAGHASLTLLNEPCDVAACGWCIYDWSFELASVAPDTALEVAIAVYDYPPTCDLGGDEPPAPLESTATIPAASLGSGILCRHTEPGVLEWGGTVAGHTPGQLNQVCRGGDMNPDTDAPACDDGLVCVTGEFEYGSICHKTCAGDSDCSLPELFSCQEKICELKAPWI